MCNFKTYSSFETPGIRGSQFPPLLKGGGPLAVEGFKSTLQTSSEARNDRKVIPRTLAPPCKAKQHNLILAPPGAYPPRLKGGGALTAEGFNLGIWRKVVPRTLAPPCRAVIPRTLAPPCSKVYNINYRYADMEAPYPALTGEVSAFGGAANIVPTSFRAAKPPDSRCNLYPPLLKGGGPLAVEGFKNTYSLDYESPGRLRRPAPFNKGAKGRGSPERIRAPQIWNDREIIPRIFVPPGAYPPRREESPSG